VAMVLGDLRGVMGGHLAPPSGPEALMTGGAWEPSAQWTATMMCHVWELCATVKAVPFIRCVCVCVCVCVCHIVGSQGVWVYGGDGKE